MDYNDFFDWQISSFLQGENYSNINSFQKFNLISISSFNNSSGNDTINNSSNNFSFINEYFDQKPKEIIFSSNNYKNQTYGKKFMDLELNFQNEQNFHQSNKTKGLEITKIPEDVLELLEKFKASLTPTEQSSQKLTAENSDNSSNNNESNNNNENEEVDKKEEKINSNDNENLKIILDNINNNIINQDNFFLNMKKNRSRGSSPDKDNQNKIPTSSEIVFALKRHGRKRKESKTTVNSKSKSGTISKHSKYSKDNIVIKIKTHLIHCIREALNESFIDQEFFCPKQNGFLCLDPKNIIKNYKNDYNEELLSKSIKDIFSENISSKYKKGSDHNKRLIEKILNENLEYKVINLLKISFNEFLEIFRGQANEETCKKINIKMLDKYSVRNLLNKLYNEEKEEGFDGEKSYKYLFNTALLCYNFERFFKIKKDKKSKF